MRGQVGKDLEVPAQIPHGQPAQERAPEIVDPGIPEILDPCQERPLEGGIAAVAEARPRRSLALDRSRFLEHRFVVDRGHDSRRRFPGKIFPVLSKFFPNRRVRFQIVLQQTPIVAKKPSVGTEIARNPSVQQAWCPRSSRGRPGRKDSAGPDEVTYGVPDTGGVPPGVLLPPFDPCNRTRRPLRPL